MYTTCIFCHAPLGANDALEAFPVGRRLAFDAAKGRMWVVCRKCERWNLTPLEERWEAIEQAERLYGATKLRVSTDNIGLARLRDGTELVRIGRPQLPEFAAWRYGDQFGRRRRARLFAVGAGLGAFGLAFGGALVAGAEVGIGIGSFGWWVFRAGALGVKRIVQGNPNSVVARIPVPGASPLVVRRRYLSEVTIRPVEGPEAWALSVTHDRDATSLRGENALRAARILLPAINRFGATREQVADAVRIIEGGDEVSAVFTRAASSGGHGRHRFAGGAYIAGLAPAERVALEMAAHDELERRAMEGELGRLEREWREAEEIARIADDLLLPASMDDELARLRARHSES